MSNPREICVGCGRDYSGDPLKPGERCLCGVRPPLGFTPHMKEHDLTMDLNEIMPDYSSLDGIALAHITPVRNSSMLGSVINTPIVNDGDGRSQWCWVRFANGDLMLGFFPQGEIYELASAMEQEDRTDG